MRTIKIEEFIKKNPSWIEFWKDEETLYPIPYIMDYCTIDGGVYSVFIPNQWRNIISRKMAGRLLKNDVDAVHYTVEYVIFQK